MISSKFAWISLLVLGGCSSAEEPLEDSDQAAQELMKNGGTSSYSCTVEQCNGNLNPFGICSHSVNGVCIECTAGSHVGTCSGPGACAETNCPPPLQNHL